MTHMLKIYWEKLHSEPKESQSDRVTLHHSRKITKYGLETSHNMCRVSLFQ